MADRASELVNYIEWYITIHRFAPSVREMQEHLGYKSTSGIHALLTVLRDQGLIEWDPGRARTIRLTETV